MSEMKYRKAVESSKNQWFWFKQLYAGKFDPVDISQTVNKNIRDNELRSVFPRKELLAIRKEYRKKPLAVETRKEPQPEASVEPVQQQPVAAAVPPPAAAQAGAAPAQKWRLPHLLHNHRAPRSFHSCSGGNPDRCAEELTDFHRGQQ